MHYLRKYKENPTPTGLMGIRLLLEVYFYSCDISLTPINRWDYVSFDTIHQGIPTLYKKVL